MQDATVSVAFVTVEVILHGGTNLVANVQISIEPSHSVTTVAFPVKKSFGYSMM
jgi:hypothetical protein